MIPNDLLCFGNAYDDGAPRRGWFIAKFIDETLGIRCRRQKNQAFQNVNVQGDFELKLYSHAAGDRETKVFPHNMTATTFSMLVGNGRFQLYFCHENRWAHVALQRQGDYAIWAPKVGHRWFAAEASSVFTIRCPAVDTTDQVETPADQIPDELKRLWDGKDWSNSARG